MQNYIDPRIIQMYNNLVNNTIQPNDSGAVTGSAIDKSDWGFAGSSVGTAGAANARDYDEGETEFYHNMATQALDRYYKGLEQLYRDNPKIYYELQQKYNTPNQYGITPYRDTNSYYMGNGEWSQ